MRLARSSRGSVSPLLHWLLVLGGLGLLAVARSDDPSEITGVAIGALGGTALGHALGASRAKLRLVLVAIVVLSLPLSVFDSVAMCALGFVGHDPVGESLMAFVPATLCAYAALSESAGLLGFWFPTALWTVGLLDGVGSSGALPIRAWLLLGVLAVLFVAMLRARETRRVALWRRHASGRLAATDDDVVLREAPFRMWGNLGFSMIVGSLALLMTAWVAPLLWQVETGHDAVAMEAHASVGTVPSLVGGVACCPTPSAAADSQHLKEYFSLRATPEAPAATTACAPCGTAVSTGSVPLSPTAAAGAGAALAPVEPTLGPQGSQGGAPLTAAPTGASDPAAAQTDLLQAPPASQQQAAPSPEGPPAAAAASSLASNGAPGALDALGATEPASVPSTAARRGWAWQFGPLLRLLFLFLVTLPLVHFVLRPLRRLVVLRHLQEPLWPETADQKVSNLWHLMLVGLKDAGFRTTENEQPQELAARVGVEGMTVCATVLERARHGARLAVEDLDEMASAARTVYREARRRLPWIVRAGSLLRWPLV